jgi:hypothetical protein
MKIHCTLLVFPLGVILCSGVQAYRVVLVYHDHTRTQFCVCQQWCIQLDETHGYNPSRVVPRVYFLIPTIDTHTPGMGMGILWVWVWVRVWLAIPGGIPMQLPNLNADICLALLDSTAGCKILDHFSLRST